MGEFKWMAPKSSSSWQYVYVNTPVEQNKSLGLDVKHRETCVQPEWLNLAEVNLPRLAMLKWDPETQNNTWQHVAWFEYANQQVI